MQIEPTDGLDADQRAVHDRLAALVQDTSQVDAKYDAIPATRGGKIVSVDVARFLVPEFSTREGRLRHTPSTATPAGAYAFDRLMRRIIAGPTQTGAQVVLLAGGAGSGKTTSLREDASAPADVVFDNQLTNWERADDIVVWATFHGWLVEATFVYRAFDLVVRGVIDRSERTGRWNRLTDLPRAHMAAQSTFWRLAERYQTHSQVSLRVIENLGTAAAPNAVQQLDPSVLAPGEPRRYSSVSLLNEVIDVELRNAISEGRISRDTLAVCAPELGRAEGR